MGYKKSNRKIIKFNKEFNFPPLITNLLNNRAFATFDELDRFLNPSTKYFHDPLMKRMEKSIKGYLKHFFK